MRTDRVVCLRSIARRHAPPEAGRRASLVVTRGPGLARISNAFSPSPLQLSSKLPGQPSDQQLRRPWVSAETQAETIPAILAVLESLMTNDHTVVPACVKRSCCFAGGEANDGASGRLQEPKFVSSEELVSAAWDSPGSG